MPLSPEQLLDLVNSGKSISEVEQLFVSGSTSDSQTDDVGCSSSLVKDVGGTIPESSKICGRSGFESQQVDNSCGVIGNSDSPTRTRKSCTSDDINNGALSIVNFDGVDIKDPVELLVMLDENILSGVTKLHDWQIKFMIDFADERHTKESPFQAAVQACNSSGKDKYIIAACAVWLCMRYREVECPITSSSGNQLDNQTGAHIDRLCAKANAVFGKLWKINYRYYEFQHIGELGQPMPSKLKLFATDEAGKAEGYHPVDAGKKMAIFTSETKSIPEEITNALERCTGFTHRVDASSPGAAAGYFYNTCSAALPREQIEDIKSLSSVQTILYKVTAYQCSHITESEIERIAAKLPGGKKSQVFLSSIMAEFGSTDEMVVIPSNFVWRAVENLPKRSTPFEIKHEPSDHNEAGLDLSDGGAETVLTVRNGNKLIGLEAFQFEDSEDSIDYLEELFRKYSLLSKDALIRGDYCGLGGPMLRSLKRKGWKNVRFVDSRNKANEPKTYANRGTELFFNMRELLQNKDIIIFYDKLLIDQLCTRYYKIRDGKIHQLLSKIEQRSKGFASPDRADSLNLCFWNYKTKFVRDEDGVTYEEDEKEAEKEAEKIIPDFDLNAWAKSSYKRYSPEHVALDNAEDLREEINAYNKRKQLIGK
jgi:hypothetical protein